MPPTTATPPLDAGPAWDVARLFPDQGHWTERDYLELTAHQPRLVEWTDGSIEVLPVSKTSHQRLVAYLYSAMLAFAGPRRLGTVLFAPLRVRLRAGQYREPDLVFMLASHADRVGEEFWSGADLVMEVVSDDPESRRRDLEIKPREYAAAGIAEYWIVEPQAGRITVLSLWDGSYIVHGRFGREDRTTSALLTGFEVETATLFG